MTDQWCVIRETARKFFRDVHRAMFPSGAPDGHGEIVARILHVQREPAINKAGNVGDHSLNATEL